MILFSIKWRKADAFLTQAAQRWHRPRPRDVTQLLQAELTGTIRPCIKNPPQGRKDATQHTHAELSVIMITMTRNLC